MTMDSKKEEFRRNDELDEGTAVSADDYFSIDTDDFDVSSFRDDRTPLGESLDFLGAGDSEPSLHSFGYQDASNYETMVDKTEKQRLVSFSNSVILPDDEQEINENSMTMDNLFGNSSSDFKDDATSASTESNESEEEDDEDTKIKKHLVSAAGGMGMMALVGWGVQKIKSIFDKNGQEDNLEGAGDLVSNLTDTGTNMLATGDGGASAAAGGASSSTSATSIASQAYVEAMSASVAQASESQLLAGAGFGLGGGQTTSSMTAAQ